MNKLIQSRIIKENGGWKYGCVGANWSDKRKMRRYIIYNRITLRMPRKIYFTIPFYQEKSPSTIEGLL